MKKKVTSLRALHKSHVEEMQNVVRLHKANSDASLEEISSLSASNRHSIEEVSFSFSYVFSAYFMSWFDLNFLFNF